MEAFLRRFDRICGFLTTVLLIALAIALLAQVILRNVFNMGPAWLEESARLFHVVLVFLALPLLEREKIQVKIDFIVDLFPSPVAAAFRVLAAAATAVFGGFFLYSGCILTRKTGDMLMSGTQLPNAVLFVPVLIGAALFTLAALASTAAQIAALKKGGVR
jgi:TRAP-type C4-dicarboxylate transport system permease small subunit